MVGKGHKAKEAFPGLAAFEESILSDEEEYLSTVNEMHSKAKNEDGAAAAGLDIEQHRTVVEDQGRSMPAAAMVAAAGRNAVEAAPGCRHAQAWWLFCQSRD